jgi:hypothetical protein
VSGLGLAGLNALVGLPPPLHTHRPTTNWTRQLTSQRHIDFESTHHSAQQAHWEHDTVAADSSKVNMQSCTGICVSAMTPTHSTGQEGRMALPVVQLGAGAGPGHNAVGSHGSSVVARDNDGAVVHTDRALSCGGDTKSALGTVTTGSSALLVLTLGAGCNLSWTLEVGARRHNCRDTHKHTPHNQPTDNKHVEMGLGALIRLGVVTATGA